MLVADCVRSKQTKMLFASLRLEITLTILSTREEDGSLNVRISYLFVKL